MHGSEQDYKWGKEWVGECRAGKGRINRQVKISLLAKR